MKSDAPAHVGEKFSRGSALMSYPAASPTSQRSMGPVRHPGSDLDPVAEGAKTLGSGGLVYQRWCPSSTAQEHRRCCGQTGVLPVQLGQGLVTVTAARAR
eukprot:768625-Hanusia_phi.AAC.3